MNDALLDLEHPRKSEAAAFARRLGPGNGAFDRAQWQSAAAFGVQGMNLPTQYGGSGVSTVDALLTFEGLGLGADDYGLVFSLSAQVFSFQSAIVSAGSAEQLERWLPGFADGSIIGGFAMTEPDVGSNTAAIETTAVLLDDSSYRIDGTKAWVTLGPVADLFLVFATVDASLGRWGITTFLVPADTPGLTVGPSIEKLGLGSCPFCEITLDGCVVPADAMLGGRGAGASIFANAVNAERAFLYASQLGAMERTIGHTIDRARHRSQFGKPIGAFQSVSNRIAEMKLRHEASRLLVYKAAMLADAGRDVTLAASLAKLMVSETAVDSVVDAMQIYGAEGYTSAAGIGDELMAAIGGLNYSGTSDIQRNIVSGLLGVDKPRRDRGEGTPE